MTAELALVKQQTEANRAAEVGQMQVADSLFIKSWHTAPNRYQIAICDQKGTPLMGEEVAVSSVRERVNAMLKSLTKKGIHPQKVYVPFWRLSLFKEIVLSIYHDAEVCADYNDDS